jgi:hypothetical protein
MPMSSVSDDRSSTFDNLECNNLDMDKIRSQLDSEPDKLLVFKRQWLRMHPNARRSPLVSSTSNRGQGSCETEQAQQETAILG